MRIAVVIPAYNRADLVGETLESVCAQTRPADEIWVIDDGSTDNTHAVAQTFAQRGVHYLFRPNGGLPAARNTGWQAASPDTNAFLFLDSDDLLHLTALARLEAALAARPDAALAYGRSRPVQANGTPTGRDWEIPDADGMVHSLLLRRNFICTAGCVLMRRADFEQAGTWDETLRATEDWDLWLRLAENKPFVRVIDGGPVLDYRLHDSNKSKNLRETQTVEMEIYEKHLRRNENTNPARHAEISHVYREIRQRADEADALGLPPDEVRLSPHHRTLRRVLGKTGLRSLYVRVVPYAVRLKLRDLAGIDRWA